MRAARQGSLDGLCGIYAVVNSLDPVGVQLGRRELREVFRQLVYSLGAAALLEAMSEGLDALTLRAAAELALGWLAARHAVALEVGLPFETRRFRSAGGYLRALRLLVDQPGTAVIIAFRSRETAHWTVISQIDGTDLHLRDSDGLGLLRTAGFGLGVGRRHFRPADTIVIQQAG